MTVDSRSRLVSVNITILDSAGAVISGPHDVSAALIDPGLSIEFPEFEARSPNGWAPFRATIDLAVDVDGFALNLDPRSSTGTPSGAALLAQGNRVDIQAAMEDRVTMRAICPPLYILKIRDAVNLPRRIVRLALGDATLLEGRTGEGERAGFERGTQTNRHTIINNYLAGSDVAATADTLTRYPLSAPPQKTSANNWAQEAGAIAGSAGAYLWLDNTGATRLTDIDFEQAAPSLSLTVGPGGDDIGTVGWSREANDVRPPEKLTCYATGSTPVEIENPRPIDETIPGDGFTAQTTTGQEEWSFGISPTYTLATTTRKAEKLILPEVRTLASGVVTGLAPNANTALRDSSSLAQTIEYSNLFGHKLQETKIERISRAEAGGNAYEPSLGDITSDAFNLLTITTTITYEYDRITGYMKRRVTSVTKAWCLVDWTGDRPVNYLNNRFLPREIFRNTETWEKAQGNTFGSNVDLPQRWRYKSTVLQPRGVIENPYFGINADILGEDPSQSFDKTGSGPEFEPPRPKYQQERYELKRNQYEGSATFTPAAGAAHKNRDERVSLRGADIVSNGQCSFLAKMLGLFRYGRAQGYQFVGAIPDWLFTGYYPGARIDITVDGQVLACLLDGWTLTLDSTSAVWGCSLVFVGVVGVTPDVVVPPVSVEIAPESFPAIFGQPPSIALDASILTAFPSIVGGIPAMALDATATEETGSSTAWLDINTDADWLAINTDQNWIDIT